MEIILFIIFAIIIVGFLVIDLGYLNRQPHKISTKSATYQSLFWISISLFYAGLIWAFDSHELAAQFLSAYVTEKMLSVDNLFVIMMIFAYFKLDQKYYHRILYWGILGAVIFRGIFITGGVAIVSIFHWVLYIFGAILIYTGWKLLVKRDDDDDNFEENKLYKFIVKYLPVANTKKHDGKFLIKENNITKVTTLFLILLLVETTDIIFAFDSIPAVFAISQNWFIIFTSNMFAIMGLRSLFFLVEGILSKFRFMQQGVATILIFIGTKMLLDIFHVHISSVSSLFFIIGVLVTAFIASVLFPKKDK